MEKLIVILCYPSNKPENRLCAVIVLRSALMLSTSFIVLDLSILLSVSSPRPFLFTGLLFLICMCAYL